MGAGGHIEVGTKAKGGWRTALAYRDGTTAMPREINWPLPVVILAGGYGTRIRHLLPDLPKPLAPVNGRPFVEWVIRFFAAQGCTEFVLSTGYLGHLIEAHFAQNPISGLTITCVQEGSPQGTAGGVVQAVQAAPGHPAWLVVNGDSLVLADPRPLLDCLRIPQTAAALLGLSMTDASRFGTLEVGDNGHLTAFREKTSGAGLINTGVYAFTARTLSELPAKRPLSLEIEVFPSLAASKRIQVARVAAPFLDIGTPETLYQAELFINQNQSQFI
jgi:NDP-sugar pyrophosphorylase family protein